MAKEPPSEVRRIRRAIRDFFTTADSEGRRIGSANCGVYAFYDYDGEPIYVGQTVENLSGRVGRHLTGRRSDAVAKFVLDPFEVLEIEVWPMFDAADLESDERRGLVNNAEHTVFAKVLSESAFGAVLNEQPPPSTDLIELPPSYRSRIIPDDLYEERKHPDIRLARRAQTIANLARLIAERQVDEGIRRTLQVQAERLEHLARRRLEE